MFEDVNIENNCFHIFILKHFVKQRRMPDAFIGIFISEHIKAVLASQRKNKQQERKIEDVEILEVGSPP